MFKEYPKFYNYEVLDYGRKSRADDPALTVEEVLEKHNKILEDYAIANLGGAIPEENKYREVGSGESLDSRPEILRLLRDIESPSIKAVMVVDVQRLSRGDLEDAGRLIKILRYTNTYVITPYKIYDLQDEYDRDAFERELKRGNEYLEYFKKIQARGILESVKSGNYVGSVAPYGYDRIRVKDGKKSYCTLVERKDQADAVRMIFEWYCNDNVGMIAICRRLEALGIPTKTGEKYWNVHRISSILQNVHYIGYIRWNWRKTITTIEDQEVKKRRPKAKNDDDYLIVKGKHEAIISEELFEKAKEIRGKRHRTKKEFVLKNAFYGIMYCSCGHRMGYNSYKKKGEDFSAPRLVCVHQYHCKSGSVFYSEIVDAICETLENCIEDFEIKISNNSNSLVETHKDLIVRLENKLKQLEEKEIAQWEAQYDPNPDLRLPPNIFKKLNEKLIMEKEEVKKSLDNAKATIPKEINYDEEIIRFKDALKILKDPELDADIKNKFLRGVIERIDFERGRSIHMTKANAKEYGFEYDGSIKWYTPPYKINVKLRHI